MADKKKYVYGCVAGSDSQKAVGETLNQKFQDLSDYIEATVKPSRLASMALTSLEQAGMSACKAVYHEGVLPPADCVKPEDCCGDTPCSVPAQ